MRTARTITMLVACCATACGGSGTSSSTVGPTAVPAGNRAPELVAATVTPGTGGWSYLTTYAAHAEARDPDGDSVTFAWKDWKGLPVEGTVANSGADIVFTSRGFDEEPRNVSPFTLTVTDSTGASTTVTVKFDNLYLRYTRFRGRIGDRVGYSLLLNQTKASLTGLIRDPRAFDEQGQSDPGDSATIDALGNFRIRFKFPN